MKLTARLFASSIFAVTASFAFGAQASIITYDLTDTPHASAGLLDAGFYQYTGGNPRYDSLSFEQNGANAVFTYDSAAGTASLAGNAYNINTGDLVSFDLDYSDVTQNGDKLTLNDMTSIGSFGNTGVTGKGFNLTLGETLVGDGWLTNGTTATHFGDFHFAGVVKEDQCATDPNSAGCGGEVPVPATGFLILAGLAGMAARRRRG